MGSFISVESKEIAIKESVQLALDCGLLDRLKKRAERLLWKDKFLLKVESYVFLVNFVSIPILIWCSNYLAIKHFGVELGVIQLSLCASIVLVTTTLLPRRLFKLLTPKNRLLLSISEKEVTLLFKYLFSKEPIEIRGNDLKKELIAFLLVVQEGEEPTFTLCDKEVAIFLSENLNPLINELKKRSQSLI
ncbi:hypothetical protein [Vibrio sp. D431a]|uniref:hypothetical protein n=1 Tax=Vibrio sp. D431a TaxID=2837388 RepID=UPI0025548705|nr:hypothetical protein [Vibrio sp. D431a]MDK9789933.1 hypothetical protein [Vibrio sp. D431a]